VAAGNAAVDTTRTNVQGTAVENSFYRYEAAASEVAYGSADRRRVEMGAAGEGNYTVRSDAGWMRVENRSNSEEIINRTLGALVYERGGTEIAYQGGAVVRADGGGSTLLSAPRLSYRYPTFTAPVIAVRGDGSSGASPSATVGAAGPTEVVYPDPSSGYENPVSGGELAVTVKSEYADAWESYFESVGRGEVTVNRNGERVTLLLPTEPPNDEFTLGGQHQLRGVSAEEHVISEFNLSLDKQSSGWASFKSISGTVDGIRGDYTVVFKNNGGNPCDGADPDIAVTARYEPGAGPTQEWKRADAVTAGSGAFTYDCPNGDFVLNANLSGDTELTYTGSPDSVTFDEHPADDGTTYGAGSGTASVDLLTNHYVALAGGDATFDIGTGGGGNGNGNGNGNGGGGGGGGAGADEDASSGYIEYDAENSSIVTYLRVTNATVNTTLN
jgi:hypothetical protein